ncbi:hypothetical protein, partial [Rhodoplanes sp. SY1]|uniref:hypothetical protein n=1 Tax=Rhodoplanes sp. SY1 TaxID=3166646 RepID=UPI0038B41C5F
MDGVMLLHWQEHCVECAVPQCYSTCRLYVPRADRRCARFAHGIVRNAAAAGGLGNADIRFRRWAKLEAELTARFVTTRAHREIERWDTAAVGAVHAVQGVGRLLDSTRSPVHDILAKLRSRLFRYLGRNRESYDAFVIECFSAERAPFRLTVDLRIDGATIFRHSVEIAPGQNFLAVPVPLPPDVSAGRYLLAIAPEGEQDVRLVFTWLDFVVLRDGARLPTTVTPDGVPAHKVKCVAWDLDNTLWRGTLLEDGAADLVLRPEAVTLIKQLDERGIIQTIVSKNDHDDAMAAVA